MFTIDLSEKNATEVVLQAIEDDASTTPSLEADAFESLLRYAYTGSITINSRNVQSILIGASFLGLLNVQQACADYLKIRLNVANVLAVKTFAFALGVETLVLASKRFIHRHFAEISRSDDFLALEFQEVVDVVDKDELNIKGRFRFMTNQSGFLILWVLQVKMSSLRQFSLGRRRTKPAESFTYRHFSLTSVYRFSRLST